MTRRERILLLLVEHPEGITTKGLMAEMGMEDKKASFNQVNRHLIDLLAEGAVTREGGRNKLWRLNGAVCKECGRPW